MLIYKNLNRPWGSPFCTFLFDSIHVCFSSCTNHCKCPMMMSLWALLWGLLIEAVNFCIQMSSLVPISVNLDCSEGCTQAHKHTHTRRPEQLQAKHKDAPSDRMQPPGERKWLYPPKQCTTCSQTLFTVWCAGCSTAHKDSRNSINHYTFMYSPKTLFSFHISSSHQ